MFSKDEIEIHITEASKIAIKKELDAFVKKRLKELKAEGKIEKQLKIAIAALETISEFGQWQASELASQALNDINALEKFRMYKDTVK